MAGSDQNPLPPWENPRYLTWASDIEERIANSLKSLAVGDNEQTVITLLAEQVVNLFFDPALPHIKTPEDIDRFLHALRMVPRANIRPWVSDRLSSDQMRIFDVAVNSRCSKIRADMLRRLASYLHNRQTPELQPRSAQAGEQSQNEDPIKRERQALLRAYKDECVANGCRRPTDRDIANTADPHWHDRTEVQRWKANDARSSAAADAKIRRVLDQKPHLKKT